MTESEWLKSNNGRLMLAAVRERLGRRKFILAFGAGPGGLDFFEQRRRGKLIHSSHAFAASLREQLGNPFRPYTFDHRWRTETVLALASAIEAERAFDRMPILADALEEAGCDERPMLDHLRGPGPHAVGCWVLDLILDREPELFSLPPLVPTPRRMRLGPFTPPPEGMA